MTPNYKAPDTPDFWLANKIFRNNFCVYALSYQRSYICFTSFHYKNHWLIHFFYILYDECSEDVTGEYSSMKCQCRN